MNRQRVMRCRFGDWRDKGLTLFLFLRDRFDDLRCRKASIAHDHRVFGLTIGHASPEVQRDDPVGVCIGVKPLPAGRSERAPSFESCSARLEFLLRVGAEA